MTRWTELDNDSQEMVMFQNDGLEISLYDYSGKSVYRRTMMMGWDYEVNKIRRMVMRVWLTVIDEHPMTSAWTRLHPALIPRPYRRCSLRYLGHWYRCASSRQKDTSSDTSFAWMHEKQMNVCLKLTWYKPWRCPEPFRGTCAERHPFSDRSRRHLQEPLDWRCNAKKLARFCTRKAVVGYSWSWLDSQHLLTWKNSSKYMWQKMANFTIRVAYPENLWPNRYCESELDLSKDSIHL